MIGIVATLVAVVLGALTIWLTLQLHKTKATLATLATHVDAMRGRGIYLIICNPAKASYLGSTSVNFHSRWGQHITALTAGNHSNPRLQQDWNRYGSQAFVFLVSEVIADDATIEGRERELLRSRAMQLLPIENYNVNHSRIYPVPALVETDAMQPRQRGPRRRRMKVMTREEHLTSHARLVALGLDDELIAAIESNRIIVDSPSEQSALE